MQLRKESASLEINGHVVRLTRLDKLFWPQEEYCKLDLISYYAEAAPFILPHLKDRPLVWTRYPDGIEGKSFYQKNAPDYIPDWITTHAIFSEASVRQVNFILAHETAVLVWLANQGALEIHPWLSRTINLDRPDFVVFDLDPSPDNDFTQVVGLAWAVKKVLDELGLKSYPKTSGAAGLHIYVPLQNIYEYSKIREFARPVAEMVCKLMPGLATIERKVNKRGPLIYVDYLQNARGQTLCAPYSVRPLPGAPVSCPLHWEELNDIHPAQFSIKTILPRLTKQGDLFAPVLNNKQTLDTAMQLLGLAPIT